MNAILNGDGFRAYAGHMVAQSAPYYFNNLQFAIVLSGSQLTVIGGQHYMFHSKQVDLFWAAVPHQPVRIVRPGRFILLHIPLPWFMHCGLPSPFVRQMLDGRVVTEKADNPAVDCHLFQRWYDDLNTDDSERRAIARIEVEARLRRLARNQNATAFASERIDPFERDVTVDMARFIAENYQRPLSLAKIAGAAGITPDWAARLFRSAWRMSPTAFVTRHRLAESQRLLATTSSKIVDIAFQSGFGTVSQFYAEFQKAYGYSPRQCRVMLSGRLRTANKSETTRA